MNDDDNRNPFTNKESYDEVNPFADFNVDDDNDGDDEEELPTNNPFIEDSVESQTQKKAKFSLFGKNQKDNEEEDDSYGDVAPVTLTLKDVQSMTFHDENDKEEVKKDINIDEEAKKYRSLDKREKIKKGTRIVRRVIEFVILIVAIVVFSLKYMTYYKQLNQLITYYHGTDTFLLKRTKDGFYVTHKNTDGCTNLEECPTIKEYPVQFGKIPTFLISVYYDITFKLHNGDKILKNSNLSTVLSSCSIHSLIHNDPQFFNFQKFDHYFVLRVEQKTENFIRGYHYWYDEGHFYLDVYLGRKESSGYDVKVKEVHSNDGELVFYVEEIEPKNYDKWINITAPTLYIEIEEKPNSVRVVNISTGEEFQSLS